MRTCALDALLNVHALISCSRPSLVSFRLACQELGGLCSLLLARCRCLWHSLVRENKGDIDMHLHNYVYAATSLGHPCKVNRVWHEITGSVHVPSCARAIKYPACTCADSPARLYKEHLSHSLIEIFRTITLGSQYNLYLCTSTVSYMGAYFYNTYKLYTCMGVVNIVATVNFTIRVLRQLTNLA